MHFIQNKKYLNFLSFENLCKIPLLNNRRKIGMNTTANKFYCITDLIGLDQLNLSFVHFKKLAKIQFLKYGKTLNSKSVDGPIKFLCQALWLCSRRNNVAITVWSPGMNDWCINVTERSPNRKGSRWCCLQGCYLNM